MHSKISSVLLCLIIGALVACFSLADAENLRSINSKPSASLTQQRFAGHYVWGVEVSSFKPCNQSLDYWVLGNDDLLEELEHKYLALVSEPYQAVYAEFAGNLLDKAQDGFAQDYDYQFWVEKLVVIRNKTDKDCP